MMLYDCLGKSPRTWRKVKRGRHTIIVKAFRIDDEGKKICIVKERFRFQVS